MKEDEMVNAIIKTNEADSEFQYEHEPERHYNHYGSRGVVDLVEVGMLTTSRPRTDFVVSEVLYEIKGPAAIEKSTGANEIVRQFNKMCSYYYLDESNHRPRPYHSVSAELCFLPEPSVIRHVWENRAIYQQLNSVEIEGAPSEADAGTGVVFRHPDPIETDQSSYCFPVHVRDRYNSSLEEWIEHAEAMNPNVAEAIKRVFR